MMKLLSILILFTTVILSANITKAQWSQEIPLTNDPAKSVVDGAIQRNLASDGDLLCVVWYDNRDGNWEIYYKLSTDAGLNWGADSRLTNDISSSKSPSLAISGKDVHIVWADDRDGNFEIYYKHSLDGGLTWGADLRLSNDNAISSRSSIALNGSYVHVIWVDDKDGIEKINYMHSLDGGITWEADQQLTIGSASTKFPSIAVSESILHVLWSDYDGGTGQIYYKRSSDGGATWDVDRLLTNSYGDGENPSVSVSGSNVNVVWYDFRDGSGNEIYYKRSTDEGITWDEDKRLTNASGYSDFASVYASGSAVHVVWEDKRDGNFEIYYKRSLDVGVTWEDDTRITNAPGNSFSPSVSVSGSVVHIIWTDQRSNQNGDIFYKRNPTANTTGVDDLETETIDVSFYPNPANGNLFLNFSEENNSILSIKIINTFGISIYENSIFGNSININTSNFSPGVYYLTVTTGNYSETKKFVVVR